MAVATRERLQLTIRGETRTVTFDESLRLARELDAEVREAKETLLRRRVRLGAFLLQVHQATEHGGWIRWLDASGINRKSAWRSIRLAREFADQFGELDVERLRLAVDAWNAANPDHPIGVSGTRGSQTEPTLRQVERLAGARSWDPLDDDEDGGSAGACSDDDEDGEWTDSPADEDDDDRGVAQLVDRRAHSPEVAGSTPAAAIGRAEITPFLMNPAGGPAERPRVQQAGSEGRAAGNAADGPVRDYPGQLTFDALYRRADAGVDQALTELARSLDGEQQRQVYALRLHVHEELARIAKGGR